MQSHKDLDSWKLSITLARDIYELIERFPMHERFGLSLQMRRAAISIASNIAEGAARHGSREFSRFLYMAAGSASELSTQLEIAKVIGYGQEDAIGALQEMVERVTRLLHGLIRHVKTREHQAHG